MFFAGVALDMSNVSRRLGQLNRLAFDTRAHVLNSGKIPVVYFTGIENVGDVLNEYLIPKISGQEIFKVQSNWLPHLRAIGSVINSASRNSYIWGSGSIDGMAPDVRINIKKIFALRGALTKALILRASRNQELNVPLGDPALLMPRFFNPKIENRYRLGIVPHFSEESRLLALCGSLSSEVRVIRVGLRPEEFVRELLSCENIFSSSLHGLILADAYGIPNSWVRFTDRLSSTRFKFLDYYSVTDHPEKEELFVPCERMLREMAASSRSSCAVARYNGCAISLLKSFPQRFRANN